LLDILTADSNEDNYVDESSDEDVLDGIEAPERTYKGPHLTFPLKRQDLDILINLFRKKKVR
jgi:serine/threonine-protein phosphatase with EF-hand domain